MIKATDVLESLDSLKESIDESYQVLHGTDASAILRGDEIILRTLGRVWKVPIIMKNEEVTTPVDGIIVPLYNPLANLMDELKKNPEGIAVKVLDQSVFFADSRKERDLATAECAEKPILNKWGTFFDPKKHPRFLEPDMPDGSGLPEYLRNKVNLAGAEGGGNPNMFYMHRDGYRGSSDEGEED
jgi:hypothetical protein